MYIEESEFKELYTKTQPQSLLGSKEALKNGQ